MRNLPVGQQPDVPSLSRLLHKKIRFSVVHRPSRQIVEERQKDEREKDSHLRTPTGGRNPACRTLRTSSASGHDCKAGAPWHQPCRQGGDETATGSLPA